MDLKKHISNVDAAQKELEAITPRTAAISVAIQKAVVFKRSLNQCVAAEQSHAATVADVNAQIDQINANAEKLKIAKH